MDGGEPADGTGQIGVVEDLLAAVRLDVDGPSRAAGPRSRRAHQRREQHIVRPRPVHRRDALQQLPGLLGGQPHGHRTLGLHRVVATGTVHGQSGGGAGRRLQPVRQLGVEATRGGVLGKPRGPLPYGGALGPQVGLSAGHDPLVGGLQVLQKDAPGHAVDDQMVRGEDDPDRRLRARHSHEDADQRTTFQVESGMGRRDERGPLLRVARMDGEDRVEVDGGRDVPGPGSFGGTGERAAQRVVLGEQRGDGRPQSIEVRGGRQGEPGSHVEVLRSHRMGVEEPLPYGSCPYGSGDEPALREQGGAGVDLAGLGGKGGNGGVEEDVAGGEGPSGTAGTGDDLETDDRVAAEVEEVVLDPDPLQPEHLRPHAAQETLGLGTWRHIGRVGRGELGCGQGAAVELAVGVQGQRVQDDEGRRNHVLRQSRRHMLTYYRHVEGRIPLGDQVGGQALHSGAVLARHDHGLGHRRVGGQNALDLAEFDTETADLDLVVATARVLQSPVRTPPHHIPGPVQPATGPERIRHEPLRRQPRTPVIPTRQTTPEIQLTPHTHRHRRQTAIQYIRGLTRHRTPNRHHRTLRVRIGVGEPARRIHRRLSRTVNVGHNRTRHRPPRLLQQTRRKRLTRQHHQTRRNSGLLPQHPRKRRRHRRNERATPRVALRQRQNIPHHLHRPTSSQRPEQLKHRHIEVERRREQSPPEAVLTERHRPPHETRHRRMRNHHTLRPTRRTRRINHIRRRRQRHRAGRRQGLPRARAHARIRARRQRPGQHRLVHHHPDAAVRLHELQPVGRVLRIQRHIRTTGPQHRKRRHHQIHRPRQRHAHPRLDTHAQRRQIPRQTIHPGTQLAIRQRDTTIPEHRNRPRGRGDTVLNQLHNRPLTHPASRTGPPHQQALQLTRAQHADPHQRHRRIRRHPLRQRQPMPAQPLDGLRVEQIRVEFQFRGEAARGLPELQREVET
ncbi:amidohydrolase 2 [Streptomyces sp. L-9-10]|nr:amidohydrolase 2 [Streptomyces sp. L-9-10]